ncbi:phage late control D family protein [Nonomuraea sp. NPDC050556]|uniref:phage late control D family protein n=1 Tax=Nonomuraea sp. NPDC050556 TaxID=3364369 RepID=UPI0037A6AD1A
MQTENFRIEIDGIEADDLYPSLLGLEVELDDELAAMLRLRLVMDQRSEGGWTLVDDERLAVWGQVKIMAGFAGAAEELIDAVITHLRPDFDPDPGRCSLEVWAVDRSTLMDRQEVSKAWPNRRDSDIAREILSAHGLRADVEDTKVSHDEPVSTVIQRETDMQFLTRLALRNGFECFVEGTTGFFRAPRLDGPPQPVLAAHFGEATTLRRFSAEVNATTPTEVTMSQLTRASKEIVTGAATTSPQTLLGLAGSIQLRLAGLPPARTVLAQAPATGETELAVLCQSLHDRSDWFVEGRGEVVANHYGHVLRPRRTVTVKGVGEMHSGVYYVSHVTHVFAPDGYIQRFTARRNGLMPTGAEQFTEPAGLQGGTV